MAKKKKPKFYVVWHGRQTGIFHTWDECAAQVSGFTDAKYKSFDTHHEAQAAFAGEYEDFKGQNKTSKSKQIRLIDVGEIVYPSYAVDAACSGNPGPVEYRCVDTNSGEEIFRRGPFPQGTNNVGEFLAIVHALSLFQQREITAPIYSDSKNAIGWIKKKKCQTQLPRGENNTELFELVDRAEKWLAEHEYTNKILKWETEVWGEIPADFGRK